MLCTIDLARNLRADVYRVNAVWNQIIGYDIRKEYLIVFNNTQIITEPMKCAFQTRYDFTPTEAEIFALLGDGFSPAEIAQQRNTAVDTVRWHIKHIYSKMGVSSRGGFFINILRAGR